MKVKVERARRDLWRRRAREISRALPALAAQGARTGLLHAQRGAMANVYSTEPGQYERTRELLRGIYADSNANASSLGIVVGDRANHASFVELGTGPYALSEEQRQVHLNTLPRGGLLRLGRSGKAYLLPGPFIGPAITYARTLTRERLNAVMADAWQ
ncbi:hypothetical protein [Deinococcus depolymerans]|uniref:HK97 gp10 family phage protein n=1 Tax=Deinococcus depolymerans TaxID=392408 RepID=A0ABN1BYU3_9DEIO